MSIAHRMTQWAGQGPIGTHRPNQRAQFGTWLRVPAAQSAMSSEAPNVIVHHSDPGMTPAVWRANLQSEVNAEGGGLDTRVIPGAYGPVLPAGRRF